MIPKRGVIILIVLALALSSIALGMSLIDSNDTPLNKDRIKDTPSNGGGEVGVNIEAGEIEDRGPGGNN